MRGTEMNHIDTRDPSSRQISTGYEEFPSNDTESTVDHSDFISAKESKENITAERSQIPPEIGEDNDTKRDRLKELLSVIAGTLRKVKDLETMPECEVFRGLFVVILMYRRLYPEFHPRKG